MKYTSKSNLLGSLAVTSLLLVTATNAESGNKDYSATAQPLVAIEGMITKIDTNTLNIQYDVNGVTKDLITAKADNAAYDMEKYPLIVGEYVTAYGYETAQNNNVMTINGVYSHDDNAYYAATNAMNISMNENTRLPQMNMAKTDDSQMKLSGVVTHVSGNEMAVKVGGKKLDIGLDNLAYNPVNGVNVTGVNVGDIVYASGKYENNFLAPDSVAANELVTLTKNTL